jgi:hypothetical protein
MIAINKRLEKFATKGFIAKRCNPDGTMAHGQRTLGFLDTKDITPVLTSSKASLQIKVGTAAWQVKEVTFTAPSALTVAAAVTALNAAAFTGCTFSTDADTGRLLLKATSTSETEIQIYGYLAGALEFGDCRAFEGLGCYYIDYTNEDETISAQQTVDREEDEQIDHEGGQGLKTTVIFPGARNGEEVSFTVRPEDLEFKQIIDGGRYKLGTSTAPAEYEPPLSMEFVNRPKPSITIMMIDIMYPPNLQSKYALNVAVETTTYYNCLGTVGDPGNGASKSFIDHSYTFKAKEYVDEHGITHANPLYKMYTPIQWKAFNLSALIERPVST